MLLTIAVVTYNCDQVLQRTLDSINKFSILFNGELEIIAIDGNSTDNTLNIIHSSQLFDFVLTENDFGIFDAMNKASKLAKGQWICYMNAGDEFYIINELDIAIVLSNTDQECAVVYGDTKVVFENKYNIYKKASKINHLNDPMPFCHQSAFTRTSLVSDIGFDIKYPRVADQKLYLDILLRNYKFNYINQCLAIIEAEGFSNKMMINTIEEELKIKLEYGIINKYQKTFIYYKAISLMHLKNITPSFLRKIKRKILSV